VVTPAGVNRNVAGSRRQLLKSAHTDLPIAFFHSRVNPPNHNILWFSPMLAHKMWDLLVIPGAFARFMGVF